MSQARPIPPVAATATPIPAAEAFDFDEFFRRHVDRLSRVAVRMLGRDGDVDDVVQDVFSIALRRKDELAAMPSVERWLVSITIKRVLMLLRWRRVRAALGLHQHIDVDQLVGSDVSADRRLTLVRLYRALDRLPAIERIAWMLRHVQGERLEDIAELCECSLATAKRRIARAQVRLDAEFLEKERGHG